MRKCVLGCGEKPVSGAVNVDRLKYAWVDVVQDLDEKRWVFEDDSFDEVIAEHVAEHVKDRLAFISECLRITKSGGLLVIEVPNWCHETAHSNLEHLTTWSRVIFDDGYVCAGRWKKEKVVYRVSFFWRSFYVKWEFLGRQLDRFTPFVSGLRFYLRVK